MTKQEVGAKGEDGDEAGRARGGDCSGTIPEETIGEIESRQACSKMAAEQRGARDTESTPTRNRRLANRR